MWLWFSLPLLSFVLHISFSLSPSLSLARSLVRSSLFYGPVPGNPFLEEEHRENERRDRK